MEMDPTEDGTSGVINGDATAAAVLEPVIGVVYTLGLGLHVNALIDSAYVRDQMPVRLFFGDGAVIPQSLLGVVAMPVRPSVPAHFFAQLTWCLWRYIRQKRALPMGSQISLWHHMPATRSVGLETEATTEQVLHIWRTETNGDDFFQNVEFVPFCIGDPPPGVAPPYLALSRDDPAAWSFEIRIYVHALPRIMHMRGQ